MTEDKCAGYGSPETLCLGTKVRQLERCKKRGRKAGNRHYNIFEDSPIYKN